MGTQRLNKTFNQLDQLLHEALQTELNHKRGKGAINRLKAIDIAIHETYANPDNWDSRGTVVVTYVEPVTAAPTVIGVFQELVHRRTQARKLVRVPSDIEGPMPANRIEYFTDQYLVAPLVDPCPPASPANPYERQAIRDYLHRTSPQPLAEVLGSKIDAAALLKQLRDMGVTSI